jgi:hypothetical protein
MPSSANGSVILPARRVGHDRAREQPAVLNRLLAGLAALYVLPTTIAVIRQVEDIPLVVILNCFPIAWPAALLLACMMPRKEPR